MATKRARVHGIVAALSGRAGKACAALAFLLLASAGQVAAQETPSRFLAREDILLYGIGLRVEPAQQTVPRDIATIVSTFLQAPTQPGSPLPPFAPDALVRATLRGPSFGAPLELTASPNTPFNIPPLTVAGPHTLENIRLVSGDDVLLRGSPESVRIDVIDRLLVTQVTARPLTAAEIREKGIVFNATNFQAYNFTAAFAVQGTTVNLSFPVVLPVLLGAQDVTVGRATIPSIQPPALQSIRSIIPDTLQIQTQVPNLSVTGFSLKMPELKGQNFIVPPIPGVLVFPGNIGFLNQFFSVLLMVSNAAPVGSNLVVSDLRASIVLPPGRDTVVGSADDPLAMAVTAQGETPRVQPVTQPGADGQLGTADDLTSIGPGETGNAEYLVEGRREGSHVVEMEIEGTLNGLPIGPVAIRGRAAGAVLVRNPTYTLTFIHPDTVTAGEPYTLDITVTNTSESPANFVSVNLFGRNISGATLIGEPTKQIEFIAPGDSETVSFDLIARITGKITAATLDSDTQVAGRFELKHSVGELGVPLSPESLVLPKEARALPADLRAAVLGMLGKAWAVATAPAAALPPGVQRFSRQIVLDMAVATAEAGLRLGLHEPLRDSTTQLAMDFFGSEFGRLTQRNLRPDDLAFAQNNYVGFDDLRRRSVRGDVLAQAVSDLLVGDFRALGPAAFHRDVAEKISYRPDHLSALVGTGGGPLPYTLTLVDAQGRQVGGIDAKGKVTKQIPFSDYLLLKNPGGVVDGQMAFLVAPVVGAYTVRLTPVPGVPDGTPFTLSVVVPRGDGTLRHVVFDGLTGAAAPTVPFAAGDPYRVAIAIAGPVGIDTAPSTDVVLVDAPPSILGLVQQGTADMLVCDAQATSGPMPGRVVALLFSEEVTAESVQDKFRTDAITNYEPEANRAVSVAMQPGGRIVFVALRDPLGPFIPRAMAVSGVTDLRGHVMAPVSMLMESTIPDDGGVVSGRVINADGTPVPFANVRLFNLLDCGEPAWVGISSKNADEQGRYSWDFVLRTLPDRVVAVDPETQEFRDIRFNVQRNGQRLNIDIVMLGRGTLTGRTLDEAGRPLANTSVRITSLTDQSQYGVTTDASGAFAVGRIPVGNVLVEAVNPVANAKTFISELIPFAGATTTRDIVLLSVEITQITVRHGNISGHVLRGDGITPVSDLPVVVYYESGSQPGVVCGTAECAIALVNTDSQGAFSFPDVLAGRLRIETFDQAAYQRGEVRTTLAADATVALNIILSAGLGTVQGIVLDPQGHGVAGARVGGGLSLGTADATGQFTLTDVPVGRASIVAVSDLLGSSGTAVVDILRAGEVVNATIVLESLGGVGGIVRLADGVTPVANIKVFVFRPGAGGVNVVGSAVTDALGRYSMSRIPLGAYQVSAFRSDFSDGNVAPVSVKFSNQIAKGDVTFRGGSGRVTGVVYDDDGVTPLRARVSVSGDQLLIAGGQVGVGFTHVSNFRIVDTDFTTGRFTLGGLWVGSFTLRAAGQFSPDPITLENTMPAAGATVQMDVRLQATSQVAGQVFLPDGVTPAGANLIVTYKSNEFRVICTEGSDGEDVCTSIPQGIQEEIVVTDTAGRFGVPIVNAGTFTLTVEDPVTGKTGQIHGSVKAGERIDVSMRLVGLGDISVRVRAGDGVTPIPGARVVIRQIDFPGKSLTAFADPTGLLSLSGGDAFSEGAFVVTATDVRNGFAGRGSGRITRDGEQVALDVFLYTQAGAVFGTVFRPDGTTTVPNAEVVVAGPGGPLAFTLTDASGAYRVDLVPLGAVTVEVFEAATARRGFATASIDADHQEVPVNVHELALGVVRGTVLELGPLSPLKGWEVSLNSTTPGGRAAPSLKTTSSVDGTFSFPGVSQGTVSLFARRDGINGSGSARGTLQREGQAVDIPVIARIVRPLFGSIQGRVFDPNGQPAGNSAIELCAGACTNFVEPSTVIAGADGTFTISQLPLGRYQLRAHAQASRNVGSGFAEIQFDGETAGVTISMVGLSQITGQVVRSDNSPAGNVALKLEGQPGTGCDGPCLRFADANGNFTFIDVPARTFTVTATDAVSGFKGVVGDTLIPGETRTVRIVLEPTGSVLGRVLLQNLNPASGVTVDLTVAGRHLFLQTGADGTFHYDTTPLGPFTIAFEDSVGTGIASRLGTILGATDVGDVRLDEAPPAVASIVPQPSATGVPLAQAITLTFTERIQAGTVTAANITLSDENGLLTGALALGGGDTTVTLTPLAPFRESTRYAIRVKGILDLVGKELRPDYVSSFTSVDLTPPTYADVSPAANTSGVPIYSPVRLKFSEPIDPTRTTGPPVTMTGPGGAVEGRLDYLFGNTVAVFTPARPLNEDAVYSVHAAAVSDVAGNPQPQGLDYSFGTTDRTPPSIASLAGPATIVENGIASVVADVGATHDVGFVDFFINDTFASTARTSPFVLNFQAIPAFGHVGDQIRVSAVATDTSGNRGVTRAAASITVTADQPPVTVITAPVTGLTARNGDRIVVTVRSTDDLGVVRAGYKAQTGHPQDAAIRTLAPTSTDHIESFGFNVPLDAAPGSTILIEASAADTFGHVGQAVPVSLSVLDAVPPTVRITGTSTGDAVRPGQQTTVVVSAQDLGGVTGITFSTSGLVVGSESRVLTAEPTSTLASFVIQVPAGARPGETVTLRATAVDRAGNVGTAANVILPVADTVAPTVTLRTANGRSDIVPGRTVDLIAEASDGISVSRVDLTGSGAFTVSDSRQVSPPLGSAQVTFSILVPDTLTPGAVLNLQARAFDLASNVSSPAFLSLSVSAVSDVQLPASTVVSAGQSVNVVVTLPAGGPSSGQLVTFATADGAVAIVTPSTVFASGQTARTIVVTGLSGGTTEVSAMIQGVVRATMTVAVQGGIVDGQIVDPLLVPVAGAQVTVVEFGGTPHAATTDANGHYTVAGLYGPAISVRALDPVTALRGYAAASLNRANGFAHVNVVLIAAGSIHGTVTQADGLTPVGEGVRVDIYAAAQNLAAPLATTFSGTNGTYEFPLVTVGNYVIDATAGDGNRGRSNAAVATSGADVVVNVVYLGRGSVSGTVFGSTGQPVPNALMTFSSSSIFGGVGTVSRAANANGTFLFDRVFVGSFQISATDPVTSRGASASGVITGNGQVLVQDLRLATYGTVRGTVVRSDGTTPVPGADVRTAGGLVTTTDATGQYAFPILPLGGTSVTVTDAASRGKGYANGTLSIQGQILTLNVQLLGQGTVIGTVLDANGVLAAGATLSVSSTSPGGQFTDGQYGTTDANGRVAINNVLAGTLAISASRGGLTGSVARSLATGETLNVTVQLEATASIAGTVFAPDGQTPQNAGTAAVLVYSGYYGYWIVQQSVPLGADGTFRFDGLRLTQTYQLGAYDAQGRLRALVRTPIALTANGDVVTRTMTFVGLGTVRGRVVNPDGSSAPDFSVQVRSLTPDFGGYASAVSNAAGFYEVTNRAVGATTVSTGNTALGLLGEAAGTLTADGDILTLDILLQSNAITLPVYLNDANVMSFDVQPGGETRSGFTGVFYGYDANGASILEVIADGVPTRITGGTIGTVEDQRREIATRQANVNGLNVTRKVFVPLDGYFARYLEILSNPTVNPITVDLRATTHIKARDYGQQPYLVATSSGDTTLSVSSAASRDRWVTIDDQDQDPYLVGSSPPVASGFDGPGAPEHVSSATYSTTSYCPYVYYQCYQTGHLSYQWSQIVVPPGGSVAYMHFISQETSRAGALAAAQRLDQLPPEAIAGLSAEEIAAIRNFAVPTNGVSVVPPLPSLNGQVSGRLFEFDGTTVVPSSQVRLKSSNPLFGRTYVSYADAAGVFAFAPMLTGDGGNVVIPIGDFTVWGVYPGTNVVSPATTGGFIAGELTATADAAFSNTGIVVGHVRRPGGGVATTGYVYLTGVGITYNVLAYLGNDGSYRYGGIPAGLKTLTVSIPSPGIYGGTALQATSSFTMTAGQVVTADVILPPTGAVTGIVRTGAGTPAVSRQVTLGNGYNFTRYAYTDSAGRYEFNEVPVSGYILTAYEQTTNLPTVVNITIGADQVLTQDLALVGIGTLSIQVNFADGTPAANATVQYMRPAYENYFIGAGSTDVTGHLNRPNFPTTAFTLRAVNPLNTALYTDVTGTLTSNGQVLPVTIALPGLGSIAGQVTFAAGGTAVNARVEFYQGTSTSTYATRQTDGAGSFALANLPLGFTWRVRAFNPVQTAQYREATNLALSTNGQVITANLVLPAQATVRVTARRADGTVMVGSTVQIANFFAPTSFVGYGATNASGQVLATLIPEGTFTVRVLDASNRAIGAATGAVTAASQGQTIDVSVTAGVALPLNLFDANGYRFDLQQDGSLSDGTSDAFDGGEYLTVVTPSGAGSYSFGGGTFANPEDNDREVAIQAPVSNVVVTRKVFVPVDGYFGRYLDQVTNPGTAPVTIDVRVQSYLGSDSATRVVTTASGDAIFTAADAWLVTDDDALATPSGDPSLAFINGGPGATKTLSNVSAPSGSFDLVGLYWNAVTIQPGQTVALMHFVVQQPTKTGAIAAAQRLALLPPEAIAGMSADERAQVINWAVPADGSSPLTPIPPVAARTGTITGRTLAGDGLTPIRNGVVTYTNQSYPFLASATTTASANTNGQFTFTGRFVEDFTLRALGGVSNATSPLVNGTFGTGLTTTTQDVVFTNTGVVVGTILRGGVGVANAGISLDASQSFNTRSVAGGAYELAGVLPGAHTVSALAGTASGLANANVAAGQVTTTDVVIGEGTISGRVTRANGAAVGASQVFLMNATATAIYNSTSTNASGNFAFTGVPLGRPFLVRATFSGNQYATTTTPSTVTVPADNAVVPVDITLKAFATARVHVLDVDGVRSLNNSNNPYIYVDRHLGSGFEFAGYPDPNGYLNIPNVVEPDFAVRANDNFGLVGVEFVVVAPADDGTTIDVPIVASSTGGQVFGEVFAADGSTPMTGGDSEGGVTVELYDAVTGDLIDDTTYYSEGYSMSGLFDPGDGFRVVAYSPFDNLTTVEALGSFAFRGESVRRDLILPVAVISGVVRHADGTPVEYPNVLVRWMSGPRAGDTSYAGGRFDGSYGLVVEQPGDFILTAQDGLSGQTQGVAGTVSDLTMAIPIDVTFGPTGSIAGLVVDGGGNGLASRVQLNVAGIGFSRSVNTQAGGTFTFNNVPAVPFHLQACDSDAQGCGSAQGVVRPWNQFEVPDPTEVTMVRREFTGVVNGVVRQANGAPLTTPADITVYVPEYSGPFYYSGFRRSVTTTGAGAYSVDGVPPGTVIVAAFDSVTSATGVASAELTSQEPIVADVILGNATALPADFSDGAFRYAIGCQGSIIGSGHVGANDSLLNGAQQMSAYFGQTSVGTQFPCVDYGRSEPAVSRVGLSGGYQDSLGVSVSRDIFVSPAAGETPGFSRYLEVLTNSTTVDMTVTVSVAGNFYTNAQTTISSDSFGVFEATGRTVVGVGIQDPTGTPPVGFATMHFPSPADPYRYSYAWLVTVPAGHTRRLMHFLVQADTSADAGVTLDSLTRLTHPNALDGMTPEEKASVVNFVVPQ